MNNLTEDEASKLRTLRREKMQQEKKRQEMQRRQVRKAAPFVGVAIAAIVLIYGGVHFVGTLKNNDSQEIEAEIDQDLVGDVSENTQALTVGNAIEDTEEAAETFAVDTTQYTAAETDTTLALGEDIISQYAVLVDVDNSTIIAEKNAMVRMNPASMTKVLTVLVAAEHITDLDDTFTMNLDITDYSFVNDCSTAGFLDGETVTVRDLFYGTILPSGGEAAVGLATYVAGSQEAFVEMMNEKLVDLGLSDTAHVTNCVGIYDADHYCTVYDMAMILEAAINNDICREVLSAHTYTTSITEQHPEGIVLSNWFLRRIEDKETIGTVVCGKTGYVTQSGNCAASYGVDSQGKEYICVTGSANSGWRCIYDHVALYDSVME